MKMLELVVNIENSRPGTSDYPRVVVSAKQRNLKYQSGFQSLGDRCGHTLIDSRFYMVCGDTQFKTSSFESRRSWFEKRYGRMKYESTP